MAEEVRDIKITVEVETNKHTYVKVCKTIEEAKEFIKSVTQ